MFSKYSYIRMNGNNIMYIGGVELRNDNLKIN